MSTLLLILNLVNGDVASIPVGYAMKKLSCEQIFQQVATISKDEAKYNGNVIYSYYCENKKGMKK
mgnify:CR=1 FL=1